MLVKLLINKQIIDKERQEIYLYGAMLFLSTTAGILSIFVLSIVFFDLFTFLVFFIFFVPLRLYAGGYHCNNYYSCFIVSNIIFLLIALLAKTTHSLVLFPTLSSIVTLVTVIVLSPVTNKFNILSTRRRNINRKNSLYIIMIQFIVINVLNIIHLYNISYYTCIASYSGLSIAFLMIIELLKERICKNV